MRRGRGVVLIFLLLVFGILAGARFSQWERQNCILRKANLEKEIYYLLDSQSGTILDLREYVGEQADWQGPDGAVSIITFPTAAWKFVPYCKMHHGIVEVERFLIIRYHEFSGGTVIMTRTLLEEGKSTEWMWGTASVQYD